MGGEGLQYMGGYGGPYGYFNRIHQNHSSYSHAQIDEYKGEFNAFGKTVPEALGRLRRVATVQSVGSSTRIEGSALSDQEAETLLKKTEPDSLKRRDEQEVAGYARVMETITTGFQMMF